MPPDGGVKSSPREGKSMPLMHLWVRHAASMAYDRPIKDQVPPTIGGRSATGLPVSISKIDLLKTCMSSFTSPILDMSEVAITLDYRHQG